MMEIPDRPSLEELIRLSDTVLIVNPSLPLESKFVPLAGLWLIMTFDLVRVLKGDVGSKCDKRGREVCVLLSDPFDEFYNVSAQKEYIFFLKEIYIPYRDRPLLFFPVWPILSAESYEATEDRVAMVKVIMDSQ